MRVLVLSSTFPNQSQPTRGVFVHERIRRLARRADVVVAAPLPWFPMNRWIRAERAGVPFVEDQEGLTVYHPRFLSLPRYGKFLDGVLCAASLAPFLLWLRRRFPFEVLDAHFLYPDGLAATLLGKLLRRPVVVTLRGSEVRLSGYPLHRPQLRWALRHADRITAVSDSLRRLAGDLGAGPGRVRVIPNGVDAHLFRPIDRAPARRGSGLPADRTILLTVGGIYAGKGQHSVVDLLPALVERHPDLLYVMVGGGRPGESYRWHLEQTVARMGLGQHVLFAGARPHAELPSWFGAADLFILPTESEGWPNVLLESLACGVPVVATRVGGTAEIVRDQRDGFLVPHGAPDALREAILRALRTPWNREALARRAGEFDWSDTVEQALEELTRALKGAS